MILQKVHINKLNVLVRFSLLNTLIFAIVGSGGKIGSQMEARRDVRSTHIEYDSCSYNPVQRVVLHGTMLHRETVMQIVHQNCRPSSV